MKAEYIDHMGTDLTVVNAARVSFNKESDWEYEPRPGLKLLSTKDKGLISYLAKHGHWTPFSHPMITMREKVPIFVARQRFKHMVGFAYNEVSRRYVDDAPEFFQPEAWRKRPEDGIKQGSSEETVTHFGKSYIWDYNQDFDPDDPIDEAYDYFLKHAEYLYNSLLESGVAPEQARMVLPQSMYTEYYVTGSLAAWARAYKLRIDGHAQKEIQDLAKEWDQVIRPLFPVSWPVLTL